MSSGVTAVSQLLSVQNGYVPVVKQVTRAWWNDAIWQGGYDEQPKFAIDLSYYETFNDELALELVDEPLHLCLNNAEDNQNVLGNS